jgi:hypothetical protein
MESCKKDKGLEIKSIETRRRITKQQNSRD